MIRVKRTEWDIRCEGCRKRRAKIEVHVPGNSLAICGECLVCLLRQPAIQDTMAELRAELVDAYRRIGEPIPEWLRGQAAKDFLRDMERGR